MADGVVAATVYLTRPRRQTIDFAAKIVRTSGTIFVRVTAPIRHRLQIEELCARSGDPPRFSWA